MTIQEATGRTPEPLKEKPALDGWLSDLAEVYWLLASSRPVGMGTVSGITTTDILAAAAAFGYEPTRFLRVVRSVDSVFLEHVQDLADQERTKNRKP